MGILHLYKEYIAMAFIGILTEHKNEVYLKKQLEEWEGVFFLDEKTIENMRNIKFETFLLGKKIESKQKVIRAIAQKANYFIINTDIKENLPILENLNLKVITYGYNQKSTITASSIEENKMMVCLQRSIKNVYQEEIEPQEAEIEVVQGVDDEAAMELASLLWLYNRK